MKKNNIHQDKLFTWKKDNAFNRIEKVCQQLRAIAVQINLFLRVSPV